MEWIIDSITEKRTTLTETDDKSFGGVTLMTYASHNISGYYYNLVTTPAQYQHTGKYTCNVYDNKTMLRSSVNVTVHGKCTMFTWGQDL